MLNYQRVTIVNDGNGTLLKNETNSREFVGLNGEYTRIYMQSNIAMGNLWKSPTNGGFQRS